MVLVFGGGEPSSAVNGNLQNRKSYTRFSPTVKPTRNKTFNTLVSGDQNETAKSNLGRGTRGDHIIHISVKVQAKDRGVKKKVQPPQTQV
jgi:hypothetical protein